MRCHAEEEWDGWRGMGRGGRWDKNPEVFPGGAGLYEKGQANEAEGLLYL